jgi:hypothetical protein
MSDTGNGRGYRGPDTRGGRIAAGIGGAVGALIAAVMAGEDHMTWLAVFLVVVAVITGAGTLVALSRSDSDDDRRDGDE